MGCAGSTQSKGEESTTKKLRKPKPWKHTQQITRTQLKEMRDEFWDTAPHYGGQKAQQPVSCCFFPFSSSSLLVDECLPVFCVLLTAAVVATLFLSPYKVCSVDFLRVKIRLHVVSMVKEECIYNTRTCLFMHRIEGMCMTKEIWDALRAAGEADLTLAQAIVESAGIIVSNADMTLCYDERGAKYELPKYVLSEPTNLIQES